MTTYLHTYSDGSKLRLSSAYDLIRIPIWYGNRILDDNHLKQLQADIAGNIKALDLQLFHTATFPSYEEDGKALLKTVLLDGQHRSRILNSHFQVTPDAENFPVLIVERRCNSEADVIDYYKLLNNSKPQEWREDPKLSAQPYVRAVEQMFNKGKKQPLIRQGRTRKPYLSVEDLQDEFVKRRIGIAMKERPDEFAARAYQYNTKQLQLLEGGYSDKRLDSGVKVKFMLGLDDKFSWLDALLEPQEPASPPLPPLPAAGAEDF